MAAGIWVRLIKRNRIEKDITVPCARADWQEALAEACHALDMGKPLVLPRHERDWEQFSQARFLKEHFVEDVPSTAWKWNSSTRTRSGSSLAFCDWRNSLCIHSYCFSWSCFSV